MLYLLSPAKTLDYESRLAPALLKKATTPLFVEQASELIEQLSTLAPEQVSALMDLSPALAELNVARYQAWVPTATRSNSRPAVLAFDGDVYGGLQARSLSATDLNWAQKHVAILSGLYGVLRPLDSLQPYRLEMGTRLANAQGADLYAFWADTVTEHLNQRQADEARPVIVNLASQEYFRAVRRAGLRARVIDCVFEDWKDDRYKLISFFAKRARGLMARWAVDQRVTAVKRLRDFNAEGYAFEATASGADRLVFRRRLADAGASTAAVADLEKMTP